MSHERPEMTGSQVVHVRENSEEAFEDLFKVLNEPRDDQPKPLAMRNLPKSFFQQPDAQKMFLDGDMSGYNQRSSPSMSAHSRAHSSPATLQQTLTAAPPLPPQHMRQHSCDLVTEDQPLPPGWDIAKTSHGQSHLSQTTTWQDPRKSVSTNNLNKQQQPTGQPSQGPGSPSQNQQSIENAPLPQGWERAYTTEGEVYYINHINRTTSWFHPSFPPQIQRPGMRLQQMSGGAPRIPQAPQMQGPRALTPEEQQRQLKLQHLQREKERLKQRQDEIARQEMMIRTGNAEAVAAAAAAAAQQQQSQPHSQKMQQANEMTSITDPFLGQSNSTELHARHDSSDSGLGGMGTSCILPRTPEDFLTPEDMETQDGGPKLTGQGEFGNVDMAALCSGSGDGGGGDTMTMDSDDLVPSLHEELSNDILKDVENVLNNKNMDNLLTWL